MIQQQQKLLFVSLASSKHEKLVEFPTDTKTRGTVKGCCHRNMLGNNLAFFSYQYQENKRKSSKAKIHQ